MMQKSLVCYSCYSKDHIIYSHMTFICSKCKIVLKRCDTCGLYCNDTCLQIFDKALTLSSSVS